LRRRPGDYRGETVRRPPWRSLLAVTTTGPQVPGHASRRRSSCPSPASSVVRRSRALLRDLRETATTLPTVTELVRPQEPATRTRR